MANQGKSPQNSQKKRARSPAGTLDQDAAETESNKSRKSSRTQTPKTKIPTVNTEEEAETSSKGQSQETTATNRTIKKAPNKKKRESIPAEHSKIISATTLLRNLEIEKKAIDESMEMSKEEMAAQIADFDLDDMFGDGEQVVARKKIEKKVDPLDNDWEHLEVDDPRIAEWCKNVFYWRQGAPRNALTKAEAVAKFSHEIGRGRDVRALAVVGNRGEPAYEREIIRQALSNAVKREIGME